MAAKENNREEKIEHLLSRNVEEVIDKDHLRSALQSGKKLRVKLGIDPTSPDLHLGHAVILRKLREFQDLGHMAVLIVGDFTGRIGDPTGRVEARKPLTDETVKENMKNYLAQAGKILDIKKAEIAYNSKWFEKEGIKELVQLASAATFQQVLRRADFKKRIDADQDITFLELLYPLFQGYDSVKIKADVELGGTDQTFNVLMGRRVERHFGLPEQDIMTLALLEGLDGVKKMSKSLGNYIGLSEIPEDMFGKVMSLPDFLTSKYFMLCTDLSGEDVKKLEEELGPKELKEKLATEIVMLYHGAAAAKKAQAYFEKVFSKREAPDDAPKLKLKSKTMSALDIVVASGVLKSKSEARRLIEQGGFEFNEKIIKDPLEKISAKGGEVVRIGKKNFFTITL
jgi:tyrosyl-tRNA synthetase